MVLYDVGTGGGAWAGGPGAPGSEVVRLSTGIVTPFVRERCVPGAYGRL